MLRGGFRGDWSVLSDSVSKLDIEYFIDKGESMDLVGEERTDEKSNRRADFIRSMGDRN
jgi:hypothetical protein